MLPYYNHRYKESYYFLYIDDYNLYSILLNSLLMSPNIYFNYAIMMVLLLAGYYIYVYYI